MGKPRKWSNVPLPEQPEPELTERELKIRASMDERASKTMRELADEYQEACEEEEFETLAQAKRSVLYEALERLIGRQLTRIQEETGHDNWKSADIGTFSPSTTVIPIVHDRHALMKHIKDQGLESLLTLESPKLRSLIADVIEGVEKMSPAERAELNPNLEEPIPGVKVWKKRGVRFTPKQKP